MLLFLGSEFKNSFSLVSQSNVLYKLFKFYIFSIMGLTIIARRGKVCIAIIFMPWDVLAEMALISAECCPWFLI